MKNPNQIKFYWMMVIGAAIGLVASFIQTLDKITLLKDSETALACNINSAVSCSTVLNSDQASVLGPPNSLISTVIFCFLLAVGLVALTHGVISKRMRLFAQFLAIFTLGFGMWFLCQSIFVIQSLCIYCIFNTFGLLLINAAWLRINYLDIHTTAPVDAGLKKLVEKGYDAPIWVSIALLIVASAVIAFM